MFALGAAAIASAQPVPGELASLATAARLDGPISGWCRGELRAGHPGGYAVAVSAARGGGGRYLVIEPEGTVVELAPFVGAPEIGCHTPARARELSLAIRESSVIHGQIVPVWSTIVVCAFVENSRAICWQYSPTEGAFVKVGEWVT